jgi:protein-disulfide isomerase
MGASLLAWAGLFAGAQTPHPWLDKRLAERRYPCPAGNSPVRGPADAVVSITEFADYDCPYCRGDEAVLKRVLAAYPTQVRLVFKQHPLDIHSEAKQKAVLSECMGLQGHFWEAHDKLLAGAPPGKVTGGVDKGKLKACVSQGGEGQVAADLALAKRLGLNTTPSSVVDGIRIGGTLGFEQFKLLIDAEIARKSASK